MPCPLPRWTEPVRRSVTSRLVQPSPFLRRVGIHDFTFEACSGFTRVTACRVAQPPKVAFVTRLRLGPLPDQAACQLPDLPTTIWVGLPPTGDLRPWGALRSPEIRSVGGHLVPFKCGRRRSVLSPTGRRLNGYRDELRPL